MSSVINLAERREKIRRQREQQDLARQRSGYICYEPGFPRSEYIRALENEIAYIKDGILEDIESCDDVTVVDEHTKMLSVGFDYGEAAQITRAEFSDWLQSCSPLPDADTSGYRVEAVSPFNA